MKSLALVIRKCRTPYLIRVARLSKGAHLTTSLILYQSLHYSKKQPSASNLMLMLSPKPLVFPLPYIGIRPNDLADEASCWREIIRLISPKMLGGGQKV